MSGLVTRLSMQANAFSNLDVWSGREPSQKETAIVNDLREAVDRIANLELALIELSQKSGSPRNVARAEVLTSHDKRKADQATIDLEATKETVPARRPRWPDPTPDKINEAFRRATRG